MYYFFLNTGGQSSIVSSPSHAGLGFLGKKIQVEEGKAIFSKHLNPDPSIHLVPGVPKLRILIVFKKYFFLKRSWR